MYGYRGAKKLKNLQVSDRVRHKGKKIHFRETANVYLLFGDMVSM